jgi:hypothetical protein
MKSTHGEFERAPLADGLRPYRCPVRSSNEPSIRRAILSPSSFLRCRAWRSLGGHRQVTDAAGTLPYANVVVLGTQTGSITDDSGNSDQGLAPATTRWASYVNYERDPTGQIASGSTATVDFQLKDESFTEKEIVVGRRRARVKEQADTTTRVGRDVQAAAGGRRQRGDRAQGGVVSRGGELHFRGGRGGRWRPRRRRARSRPARPSASLGTVALQSSEIITGGFEAEYGNAQSGVINYETREGTEDFGGDFRFYTDDYGAPDRTFHNFDRVSLGFGGPTTVRGLTYFLSYEGTFTDTYLKTSEVRSRHDFLDFISLGDRQNNDIKPRKARLQDPPNVKLTGEYLNNRARSDSYNHRWSRTPPSDAHGPRCPG